MFATTIFSSHMHITRAQHTISSQTKSVLLLPRLALLDNETHGSNSDKFTGFGADARAEILIVRNVKPFCCKELVDQEGRQDEFH